MGFGAFDQANLGVVGFVRVAQDGTVLSSSGLVVEKTGAGSYNVFALRDASGSPADPANQKPIFSDEDLIIATPNNLSVFAINTSLAAPHHINLIIFLSTTGAGADAAFSLLILRPLRPE